MSRTKHKRKEYSRDFYVNRASGEIQKIPLKEFNLVSIEDEDLKDSIEFFFYIRNLTQVINLTSLKMKNIQTIDILDIQDHLTTVYVTGIGTTQIESEFKMLKVLTREKDNRLIFYETNSIIPKPEIKDIMSVFGLTKDEATKTNIIQISKISETEDIYTIMFMVFDLNYKKPTPYIFTIPKVEFDGEYYIRVSTNEHSYKITDEED